jgi:hypothetical protein
MVDTRLGPSVVTGAELKQSRRQTAAISQERDDLVDRRNADRSDQDT